MSSLEELYRNYNYFAFSDEVDQNVVLVEYIWQDGFVEKLRSKSRVCHHKINSLADVEQWWSYCPMIVSGVVTIIEIRLKPAYMVSDPFRGAPHVLVLCETYLKDSKTPARNNYRCLNQEIKGQAGNKCNYQFQFEQYYTIMKRIGTSHIWPLGWPLGGVPYQQSEQIIGRTISEAHLHCCLNAGIAITGVKAQQLKSQWSYKISSIPDVELGDQVEMAKYILERVGEELGVTLQMQTMHLIVNEVQDYYINDISTCLNSGNCSCKAIPFPLMGLQDECKGSNIDSYLVQAWFIDKTCLISQNQGNLIKRYEITKLSLK